MEEQNLSSNKEKTTKQKRKAKKIIKNKKLFILIFLIFFILGSLAWSYFSSFESTDDAFIEAHIIRVSPKISGIINKLHIDDNRFVKKGDLLIEIDDRDYKVRYEQAKSAYEGALYKQKAARADTSAAETDMELAEKDWQRYQNLYKKGAVSKQELDKAQSRYELSKARHITSLENVFSKRGNKVADADLKRLKALMEQSKLELSYTKIYATEDGKITNKSAEEGAFIHAGAPLFSLVPKKRWVVANFKETQLEHIRVGQEVDIKVDAFPHLNLKGKVDSIQSSTGAKTSMFPPENAVGSYVKVVQRVPVKIIFEDNELVSKYNIEPGMSVIPKVHIK